MTYTKYAAIAATLLVVSSPALANPVTDSVTREWNYMAPSQPNSTPPQMVVGSTITCAAGQTAKMGTMGVFCDGVPAGRFVRVNEVPAGYTGRVYRINTRQGRGNQGVNF